MTRDIKKIPARAREIFRCTRGFKCIKSAAHVAAAYKNSVLADKPVKLFSFDGKTWVSQGRDMTEFNLRPRHIKATLQNGFCGGFEADN